MEPIRDRVLAAMIRGLYLSGPTSYTESRAERDAEQLLEEYDSAMLLGALGDAVLQGTIWGGD